MPIYANKLESGAVDIIFLHQKMRIRYLGTYQKRAGKIFARFNKRREKNMLGPSGFPLLHLSVD